MVFEGNVPPFSGVYEDALEATEEQVAAALGQFIIQEELETEDIVEIEVMEVIVGIVETAVAAVEAQDVEKENLILEGTDGEEEKEAVSDSVAETHRDDTIEVTEALEEKNTNDTVEAEVQEELCLVEDDATEYDVVTEEPVAEEVIDEEGLKPEEEKSVEEELNNHEDPDNNPFEEAEADDVKENIVRVVNDLVEAVQFEDDKSCAEKVSETKEDLPQETEQHESLEHETEYIIVDAREAGDEQQADEKEAEVLLKTTPDPVSVTKNLNFGYSLLPRHEPSSETTTTTIEPFILTTDSLDAHFPQQQWIYEVYGFSIKTRVVYYHVHKTDRRTGIRNPPILRRYTDFRELQIQLLDTRLHAAGNMPLIPKPHIATVFRGYKSKKTIKTREKAFRAVLRYISQYPVLYSTNAFELFIESHPVGELIHDNF